MSTNSFGKSVYILYNWEICEILKAEAIYVRGFQYSLHFKRTRDVYVVEPTRVTLLSMSWLEL